MCADVPHVATTVPAPVAAAPGTEAPIPGATARGLGYLLFTAVVWGLNWPVLKFLLGFLPPFSMRTTIAVIGTCIGFGIALSRGESLLIPRGERVRTFLYSLLNFGLFSVLTSETLTYLSASEGVIFVYTMPIWASLLAWLVYQERMTRWRVLALALGFAGIVVLVGPGVLRDSGPAMRKLPGVLLALAAAVMFALGTVLAKHRQLRLPPIAGVAWQAAFGILPPAVLAVFEHPDWSRLPPLGWAAIAYGGLFPMIIAYLTWFRALKLLPSSTAAIGTLIAPLVGVGGSALLLGEPLGLAELAALVLTLSGVALAVRR